MLADIKRKNPCVEELYESWKSAKLNRDKCNEEGAVVRIDNPRSPTKTRINYAVKTKTTQTTMFGIRACDLD